MKTIAYILLLLAAALGYRVATSPEWQSAIGAAATSAIRPMIIPLIELINIPAFVYVVAVLILLAGIAACVAYWVRAVRPRLRQLKAVGRGIVELPMPSIGDAQARWPEAMHRLGALLRSHSLFVSAWSEFQTESAKLRGIPNVPFSHFVASEPPARERAGLMQSLPGYFTSVGLIFTFIGLVVALYFAARGFRSGNMQEARQAIIQLLNAASFKFLTSVAALISALLVSLFLRLNLSVIARETISTVELIESFLSAWRERVGVGPSDAIMSANLLERLEALHDGVQNLTRAIERMTQRYEAPPVGAEHAVG